MGAYLLIMMFCWGVSAGLVAKIKGGSFAIWFLIGFCLPIFGTLAALASRWERDELQRRCPTCNKLVPLYDQVCTGCGTDLEFPEFAIAPPRPRRITRKPAGHEHSAG